MDVGCVRMRVLDRAGRVRMAVRLGTFPALMSVLMVIVVDVHVDVGSRRVVVRVQVTLVHQE